MRDLHRLLLLAIIVSAACAAEADDVDKEARAQFERGVELYDEGKFDQAAIAFARAYELKPSYKLLYNIAQTENQLGHYTAALEAYSKYLEEGATKIEKKRLPQVESEIERLKTLVGTVSIAGDEDGAQVFIDSRAVGNTPLPAPVMVDVGEHEILVKHDGAEVHREVVKVAGGDEVTVRWMMPRPADRPQEGVAGAPASDGKRDRLWTWISLGVAGAAGIAGGALGGVALSSKKDIEADCVDGHCPSDMTDDRDRVKNLALAADVMYGVAGAAAVAAVVLFFVEPGLGDEREATVAAAPAVGNGSVGLSISGRF